MQLVYFNDLHKNLGCNMGITSIFSIIPVIFTAVPIKSYAPARSSLPSFSARSLRPRTNAPFGTDISIAQKTCVFQQGDISVSVQKCNKLIYQSPASGSIPNGAHSKSSHAKRLLRQPGATAFLSLYYISSFLQRRTPAVP